MRSRRFLAAGEAAPILPGVALAAAVGLVALGGTRALAAPPTVSDVLVALLLGAAVAHARLRRDQSATVATTASAAPAASTDQHAAGLRFTATWVLRAAIVLMGFKMQTQFFGLAELTLIAGVAAAALPSVFFVTHALAARVGVPRATADLIAGGTMICGTSAVNALAPVTGAQRQDQGIAIGTIFLFSIVALLAFRPVAALVGLDTVHAGLWSGLSVNDMSSAIAVGKQMGDLGAATAAASKSARVVLLAPTLIVFALLRRAHTQADTGRAVGSRAVDALPRFVLGYLALAVARAVGDRVAGNAPIWKAIIAFDRAAVDVLMVTVAAGIGLGLDVRKLLSAGGRALAVGGAASCWMASLTLVMIALFARGASAVAALVGASALAVSFAAYRAVRGGSC